MALTYLWQKGLESALPSPGVASRLYFATDTGRIFLDNVSAWQRTNLYPRGVYSAGTTYQEHDLVTSQGSTWRALGTVTGVTPVEGASWTIFAAQGAQGIQGGAGSQGSPGVQGASAYTTTSASFTQPAANVSVTVGDTSWMASGQELYVQNGGYYAVSSITNATTVVLTNSVYPGNAAQGATVASGSKVTPGGLQGVQGPAGAGYGTVQEDGSALTQQAILNFGSNVTAANNAGAFRTDVSVPDSSETAKGAVELATAAETTTGTDNTRAVHPAGLKVELDKKTNTTRAINTTAPLSGGGDLSADRTLIVSAASESATGVSEIATQAETDTGTDDARYVTPLKLATTPRLPFIGTSAPSSPPEGRIWYDSTNDRVYVNIGTSGTPVWRQIDGPHTFAWSLKDIVTGAIPNRVYFDRNITIARCRITLGTALSSGTLTVDLEKAPSHTSNTFTTLYSTTTNRPSIAATTTYGATNANAPNTVDITAGEHLRPNVISAGVGGVALAFFMDYFIRQ